MDKKEGTIKMVSIIIPFHNSEKYIGLTIKSVLEQTYTNFEILCLDDGSTDQTADQIKNIVDQRILYIFKSNSGVSDTRNKGLKMAKGEYILFLDSDDILAKDFLEKRVKFLGENLEVGFCGSYIHKINEFGSIIGNGVWRGVHLNIIDEVLSYNLEIITCPSNYIFRKDILIQNSIRFNTLLSSSADKFFLVEISRHTSGGLLRHGGELYYRVHKLSMSNNFCKQLVSDNLQFKKEILNIDFIPDSIKNKFSFRVNYILAGSYFKLGNFFSFSFYAFFAFFQSPINFFMLLMKKQK